MVVSKLKWLSRFAEIFFSVLSLLPLNLIPQSSRCVHMGLPFAADSECRSKIPEPRSSHALKPACQLLC